MPTTFQDMDRQDLPVNQGGAIFIEKVDIAAAGDDLVVWFPDQMILGITIMANDFGTIQLTNYPKDTVQANPDNAQWVAWDGASTINPSLTAVRFKAHATEAVDANISIRTFKG